MPDPTNRIERHDVARDPRRLRLKYAAMAGDAFAFFRATAHLFYDSLRVAGPLRSAPPAWVCGDLHLENFGSFRGDSGLVYFDINDFDEACLAPCTWDILRFETSLLLGAKKIGVARSRARRLASAFADVYAATLADGSARWLERETVEDGLIRELIAEVGGRTRAKLVDKRTTSKKGGLALKVDEDDPPAEEAKALPADPARARLVRAAILSRGGASAATAWRRVLDVADRVAGLGSLGLDRYVVLAGGRNSGEERLLDVKAAPPSSAAAVAARSGFPQPAWGSQAERIVKCQRRLQAVPPALLDAVDLDVPGGGKGGYVLRELLPSEERVELKGRDGDASRLEGAVADMARLAAWAHLRASGRQGAASADDLEAFGRDRTWRDPLARAAMNAARDVVRDHATFRRAWGRGSVALPP